MKSLVIIDNFNKENEKFEKRFRNSLQNTINFISINWIHYTSLTDPAIFGKILQADGLILSGSYEMASDEITIEKYNYVIRLIENFEKPILGICFGLHLIGIAYGASIAFIEHEDYEIENEKVMELHFDKDFPLAPNTKLWVYQTHHQELRSTKHFLEYFRNHASSNTCKIQAISHHKKPIFGVQFHPENPKNEKAKLDGILLLENFIKKM